MNFRVKIVSRKPAPAGVRVPCLPGGGSFPIEGLYTDLDAERPNFSWRADEDESPGPFPPLEIEPGKQRAFNVLATSKSSNVIEWVIEYEIHSDGASKWATIDDQGQPFRTVGSGAPARCMFDNDDAITDCDAGN